ncbi:MAG TPA: hypothetical protein VHL79_19245 [Ramlibacter sp.]|jgi:hypothetical protein|nr:hypothetical protein [Ramlibacter sp.]
MSALSRITCHAVHALPAEQRERLAHELFAVHTQIFAGLSFEEFRNYVVERQAWRTWIYVRRNTRGETVGYTSVHVFRLDVDGRATTVIRMEAGTLPEARGQDLTMVRALVRLIAVWLAAPWRRTCIFAALTHPSSYTFLAHYAPVIWPHVDRKPIPPEVLREMEHLAAAFELERISEGNPLLRRVEWITRESEEDRQRWRRSQRRDTRFYLRANPGYTEGHGLLTYIPVNGMILLHSMGLFLSSRAAHVFALLRGKRPVRREVPPPPIMGGDSRIGSLESHFGRLEQR